jgi:hypothetical protein
LSPAEDPILQNKEAQKTDEYSEVEDEEEDGPNRNELGKKFKAVSNLVDYVHVRGTKTGVDQIYNVVYSGGATAPQKSTPTSGKLNQKNSPKKATNLIKIDVNLADFKKMYPMLDPHHEGMMKVIGEHLIDGIRIDAKGELRVD